MQADSKSTSRRAFVFGSLDGDTGAVPLEDRCRECASSQEWQRLHPRRAADQIGFVASLPGRQRQVGTDAELTCSRFWGDVRRSKVGDTGRASGRRTNFAFELDDAGGSLVGSRGLPYDRFDYRGCSARRRDRREWGRAPGAIDSFGGTLLVQGVQLGNVFVGVQPTFGYEGDPMKMLMARNGAPHHGFAAFYAYVEKVFGADAVVHVGTHGALEFMPGKQVGLSASAGPTVSTASFRTLVYRSTISEDRVARRRAYAELISYLTRPV